MTKPLRTNVLLTLAACVLFGCGERIGDGDPDPGASGVDAATGDATVVVSNATHRASNLPKLDCAVPDAPTPADAGTSDGETSGAGDRCQSPIMLFADMVSTDDTANGGEPAHAVCNRPQSPQRYYSFVLPAQQRAVVTVTPLGEPWRAVVRVMANCQTIQCLRDDVSSVPGAPVRLVVDSPGLEPLTKSVSVGYADRPGAFSIVVRFEPLPNGGPAPVCSLPVVRTLTLPMDQASGVLSESGSMTAATCVGMASGSEAIHALHVATRTPVELRGTCSSIGCAVAIRRDCDAPTTEIACNRTPTFSGPPIGLVRTILDPGNYFVVVDAANFGGGIFDYTLTLRTFDPAPNFTCEDATPVSDGTVLRNQDLGRGGSPDLSCGGDENIASETLTLGEILYYRATIPAGYTLRVATENVVGIGGLRLVLRGDCAAGSCLAPVPRVMPFTYANTTGAPQTVVFGIAPTLPLTAPRVFDLLVDIDPSM